MIHKLYLYVCLPFWCPDIDQLFDLNRLRKTRERTQNRELERNSTYFYNYFCFPVLLTLTDLFCVLLGY
jgi:hypothetical protein